MSQIAFDIDTMLHELEVAALPAWDGMPRHAFAAGYYTPAEHEAMLQRLKIENAHWSVGRHAWRSSHCLDLPGITDDGHTFVAYTADTRCQCKFGYRNVTEFADAGGCRCVGDLLTKTICEGCAWHHIGTEAQAVEAWMSHAFPDWQTLPIFPPKLRGQMGSREMTEKRQGLLKVWLTRVTCPTDWLPLRLRSSGPCWKAVKHAKTVPRRIPSTRCCSRSCW